jgi:hypothetical protein
MNQARDYYNDWDNGFNEGFGPRIETSIRIINKMVGQIENAIDFLKEKLNEIEANNGELSDENEKILVPKIIDSAEYGDYSKIVRILKSLNKKQRYNFNSLY